MSKAIIGATLTTDVGQTGSYAASKTHNEVRLDLVKSDCWSLANTLRMQLLRPLVGFNFGWDVPVPWFQFQLQEPEDLRMLSEVYKAAIDFGQPVSAEHVSDRFGIPLPQDGETVLQPVKPPGPMPFSRTNDVRWRTNDVRWRTNDVRWRTNDVRRLAANERRLFAKSSAGGADPLPGDTLDALEQKIEAEASLGALMKPIEDLLSQAGSLDEFRDKLLDAYGNMDASKLAPLLQKAFALAELSGRFDAGER
jgi:phage gp29-like protein